MAYDFERRPLSHEKKDCFLREPVLYPCCNNKIQQFDLVASRAALLKVLMLSTPDNFTDFAMTLTCDEHRSIGLVPWVRTIWFKELACRNRNPLGSCSCCSTQKPPYRWDAGVSDRQAGPNETANAISPVLDGISANTTAPPEPSRSRHAQNDGAQDMYGQPDPFMVGEDPATTSYVTRVWKETTTLSARSLVTDGLLSRGFIFALVALVISMVLLLQLVAY